MKKDLTGERFGRLLVIGKTEKRGPDGSIIYECLCDCGNICFVSRNRLIIKGHSRKRSCGCLHDETHKQHGWSKTSLFHRWTNIKDRCFNEKCASFKYYGGRGIKMCKEWKDDFATFKDWAIQNGYKEDLTIDRIDVNGDYCPENCRWITMEEQQKNKRNVKKITYNGETHSISEWAKITGIKYGTLWNRIKKGIPIEKALILKDNRTKV